MLWRVDSFLNFFSVSPLLCYTAAGRLFAEEFLSAFGQPGVEKVLEMLNAELAMVMGQVGARTIAGIESKHVGFHNG